MAMPRRCSGHWFECPREQFGSNNLPSFFKLVQLVVDTKQVVCASKHPADVWLGGASPWVRRIIGISPARQVGSVYDEAILDSNARVWMGKDVIRTTKSDHEHRTSFLLGTLSLKAAGCSVDLVVVIAHCGVVMRISNCCMALGRLQMTNIERLANVRLAPVDHVTRAAIHAMLHEDHTGCHMGKDGSPDVEETCRLFATWQNLALLLAVAPDEPLYKAVF